jgi:hypothetical protein
VQQGPLTVQDETQRQEEEQRQQAAEGDVGDLRSSRELAALDLIKRGKFSRDQYLITKYWLEDRALLDENNNSLPAWPVVTGQVRKDCLPDGWPEEGEVTAAKATVNLQKLLNHTAARYGPLLVRF